MTGGKIRFRGPSHSLWLLLLQMTLCIPFAIWRGGAFATTFEKFSKGVVVAMLISMAVVTLKELRRLLWISVSAVALVTARSDPVEALRRTTAWKASRRVFSRTLTTWRSTSPLIFPGSRVSAARQRVEESALGTRGDLHGLGIVLTYSRSGLLAIRA